MRALNLLILIAVVVGTTSNAQILENKGQSISFDGRKVTFQFQRDIHTINWLSGSQVGDSDNSSFPGDLEPVEPVRFGTWKTIVKKRISRKLPDGVIDFEEIEVCSRTTRLPIYDVRGKENFSIEPPEDTMFSCETDIYGVSAWIHLSGLIYIGKMLDPFSGQHLDMKHFSVSGSVFSDFESPLELDNRFLFLNGITKDLATQNLILQGSEAGSVRTSPGDCEGCRENYTREFYSVYSELLDEHN